MAYAPTDEQAIIVAAAKDGEDLVIQAGAGAGKTSTLRYIAEADYSREGIYIAYNRAIAEDAKRSFPSNVKSGTAHSFAFRTVGLKYKARLDGPRMTTKQTANKLGILDEVDLDGKKMPATQLARLVMECVANYCHSAEEDIRGWHVPIVEGLTDEGHRELNRLIVSYARAAWDDIRKVDGVLRFEHDHYLKLWGLQHPKFFADYVMLDEAQDANPVIAAVVEEQKIQRIMVGDTNQAIYGWRGAVDAMENFKGKRLFLTQSFRFGQAVADEANKWLKLLGSEFMIRGYEKIDSVVRSTQGEIPNAILCRTNSGAMSEAINQLNGGKRVAIVGGADTVRRLAVACEALRAGQRVDHPELFMFESWEELREYANEDVGGSDLKVFVKMVDEMGTRTIIDCCDRLSQEYSADVVVSTAHKAKGREWDSVRIAGDFQPPKDKEAGVPTADAMLAYVSITRAKLVLDRTGLAWVDQMKPMRNVDKIVEWADTPHGKAAIEEALSS